MSGGKFNYADIQLRSEIFGESNECSNVFEDFEISELVWDVLDLIHEFDMYKSCDNSKSEYLEARQNFKDKWLNDNKSSRRKAIINKALLKCKDELYQTFDIDES